MTTEQIMMKLAEIRGKSNATQQPIIAYGSVGSNESSEICEDTSIDDASSEPVDASVSADGEHVQSDAKNKSIRVNSKELVELAMKWGATISDNGFLIENSVSMTRKEYLKHIKNMNVDQVVADPLLYVMFRSEEQGEANFFSWLERFPKAKK